MRCPDFLQSVRRYLGHGSQASRAGKRQSHKGRARLGVNTLERRDLMSGGTWTQITELSGNGIPPVEHEMLLPNGNVLLQAGSDAPSSNYYVLKPNGLGDYGHATVTRVASSNVGRLFYASDVLRVGRVLVLGGEYNSSNPPPNQAEDNTAEIYDPLANTWTTAASYPQSTFGDGPSAVLPDGRVLTGWQSGTQCYVYDPSSNSWSQAASKLYGDNSDEEGWVKLPDGSILTVDVNDGSQNETQRYVPQLNEWVSSGTTPQPLYTDSSYGGLSTEIGPGILLPTGQVFWIGGTGHTAIYTPSTTLTGTGTWSAGPDIPGGLGATDAPCALEPNGNVLFSAQALNGSYENIQNLFEYNPSTNQITAVSPPSNANAFNFNQLNFITRMAVLPTGQILYSPDVSTLWLYTPNGSANPAWAPTISNIVANTYGSYTLTGTQLEGLSEGSTYGDDDQNASNF